MGRRKGSRNGERPTCPYDGREAVYHGFCATHWRRYQLGQEMDVPIRHWGTGERAHRKTQQTKEYKRLAQLQRVYGISPLQFEEMFAKQGERCAICGGDNHGRTLHVDHNHATGEIRALLCAGCNTALGLLHEDADIAAAMVEYIEAYE